MYIQPNSTVRLIKNCPIDASYSDTIYFDSTDAQYNYFSNLDGLTFQALSYIRKEDGVIRIESDISQVYNVNYMMFRNTSFENRWFYAFVTSVNYINNAVAEIHFVLDVIQSWFIQSGMLEECYVEREMAVDDTIGANIKTEPVGVGDYVFNYYNKMTPDGDTPYCVVMVTDVSASTQGGKFINRIYSGSKLYAFSIAEVDNLNALISTYTNENRGDAITAIFMCPSYLCQNRDSETYELLSTENASFWLERDLQLSTDDTLDGYKPKNNKVYTYPYNFYHVDNGTGTELNLRYEFFKDLTPAFQFAGIVAAPPQLTLRPKFYKNLEGDGDTVNTEMLSVADFPQCSWANDGFQAYLASIGLTGEAIERNPLGIIGGGLKLAGSLASALTVPGSDGLISGKSGTSATNVVGAIGGAMTNLYTQMTKADTLNGNFNGGNVNWALNTFGFYKGRMSITAENAKAIDDYFSLYGYNTMEVKVPNISSRDHWNFIKTVDCKVSGNIPTDDIVTIETIFNTGLTFWKHGNEVRNYELDNTIKETA